MRTGLLRRRGRLLLGVALAVAAILAVAVVAFGGSADVVVYNGRSQYGDEAAFELFERLRSEGSETPADLLVTTDLANLWRAEQAGLLAPVDTARLEQQVPAQ